VSPPVGGQSAPAGLYHDILAASHARRALILTGSNTNDLFETPQGSFVYLRELVALAHAAAGRVAVVYSSLGMVQDPVPGQVEVPIRLPAADTRPGQALRQIHDQLVTSASRVAADGARRDPDLAGLVIIFDYANMHLPTALVGTQPSADQQLLIETLVRFPTDGHLAAHRLVVIDRAHDLDPRLARFPGWEVIAVDPPDEALRHRFSARIHERSQVEPARVARLDAGFGPGDLARNAGGLTLDEMMRGATAAAERRERLTARWVRDVKVSRLRQRGVEGLDILPSLGIDQIAGLPQVRLFIQERLKAGIWPRAIVLAGPPGVGKTLVVRAMADVQKWPAVAIGNLRGPFVGETERNTREALATIEALAPLVVFQDEVDQVMGQRETGATADGGTSARLMAEFWRFLGDSNSGLPVLFIMATNRPDLLDNATRSRSEIIPILHPTTSEQADLLRIACTQNDAPIATELAARVLDQAQLGLVSGRMLVKLAQRAQICAAQRGASGIELADLRLAAEQLFEHVDPIEDERMALKAIAMASFTTYLPWVAAKELDEPIELLPYIEPLLNTNGVLDRALLGARIAQLDAQSALGRSAGA